MPYIVGDTGISSIFEDQNPLLGGDLNINSKSIIGSGSLNIVGIITATSFVGDGSNLSGVSTFSGDYNDLTNKPSIPSIVGLASEGYVDNLVAISTSGLLNSSGNGSNLTGVTTTIYHARIVDAKSAGSAGGVFSNGAWRTRDLNTEIFDEDNIVSISSNRFTLQQPGRYKIFWSCPANKVDSHVSRLYNITDSSVVAEGTFEYSQDAGFYAQTRSTGVAVTTVSVETTFELQHRCSGSNSASDGFGVGGSDIGQTQSIFTDVTITKYS
jgi:hypothetical protein